MDRLFPQSSLTLQAHHLLGDKVNGWGKLAFLKSPDFKQTKNLLTIPEKYDLVGTFPNPFNPSTTIRYALPRLSTVEVTIYNLLSQKVKAFTIASQPAGLHDLVWDGTGNDNTRVSSGIYIIHLRATSLAGKAEIFEKSIKATLLK